MSSGIRKFMRPEDIPQDLVGRFAQIGLKITSLSVSILNQVDASGDMHFMQAGDFASFAKTAPVRLVLWYEISHHVGEHDMSTWRRWEYTVSSGNMRWTGCGMGESDGPTPALIQFEDELALELLGAVI